MWNKNIKVFSFNDRFISFIFLSKSANYINWRTQFYNLKPMPAEHCGPEKCCYRCTYFKGMHVCFFVLDYFLIVICNWKDWWWIRISSLVWKFFFQELVFVYSVLFWEYHSTLLYVQEIFFLNQGRACTKITVTAPLHFF